MTTTGEWGTCIRTNERTKSFEVESRQKAIRKEEGTGIRGREADCSPLNRVKESERKE